MRRWSLRELTQDAATAKGLFRQQRLAEPLARYSVFFRTFAPIITAVIDQLPTLTNGPLDLRSFADIMGDDDRRTAFRYLAAPPLSDDDLKTLAESTLSGTALRSDPEQARRVRDTVLQVIDPHRFPWVADRRAPSRDERLRAVIASTALVAARKVETARRSGARRAQEEAVGAFFRTQGYINVPTRHVSNLQEAPGVRQFCRECLLGDTRADLLVGLPNGRVMPIECKVSNSAVNSFKRINHEAVGKARTWVDGFGTRQVIPIAVINGVFNPTNLAKAQSEGLFLVWSHRLHDLLLTDE